MVPGNGGGTEMLQMLKALPVEEFDSRTALAQALNTLA